MKTANRLQLSFRARAGRLALLFAMVVVWGFVVLALQPNDGAISAAPRGDRMSPTPRSSTPAPPVRV